MYYVYVSGVHLVQSHVVAISKTVAHFVYLDIPESGLRFYNTVLRL